MVYILVIEFVIAAYHDYLGIHYVANLPAYFYQCISVRAVAGKYNDVHS